MNEKKQCSASSFTPCWQLKSFFFCHLLTLFIIISFLWPATRTYWDWLDLNFFKATNGTFADRERWQVFWAACNHWIMDWVGDGIMLVYFLYYIVKGSKEEKNKRISTFLFSGLYIAFIAYFINRILFRKFLEIPRDSPTLVVDSSIFLSDHISWMSIKDASTKSFPGDHATTALSFAFSYAYFAGWRLGLLGFVYAIFICFPRMMLGAHWLSDVLVGSIPISLLCFAWFFCTPLKGHVLNGLLRFVIVLSKPFSLISKKKRA